MQILVNLLNIIHVSIKSQKTYDHIWFLDPIKSAINLYDTLRLDTETNKGNMIEIPQYYNIALC